MYLFFNSFDVNSTTSGMDGITFSGSPTLDTTVYHGATGSDQRSLKINSLASATPKYALVIAGVDAQGPDWFADCRRFAAWPSADNTIMLVLDLALTGYVAVKIGSTGLIKLFNQATQIGSSFQLSLSTWYHLALKVDKSPAAGSEELRLYVNRVEVAGAANLTMDLDGITYWFMGMNILSEANTAGELNIDDFTLNDSTGSVGNGVPDELYISAHYPNADGDNGGWTAFGSATRYQNVDENPPNDNTDYNYSNTATQIDDYNVTDPTFDDAAIPVVVQVVVRKTGVGALGGNATAVARLKAASGGTVLESSGFTDTNNTYDVVVPIITAVKPGTSDPWTKTDVTNAQIGLRLATASTNALRVTNIRLMVAFKLSHAKALTDTVVASDSISKMPGLVKTDSMAAADVINNYPKLNKADTVTLADVLAKLFTTQKADTVSLTDLISKLPGLVISDTANIADTILNSPGLVKTDSMALADDLVKAVGLSKTDPMAIADALVKVVGLNKTDALVIAEALIKNLGLNKADTMTVADALVNTFGMNPAETVAVTDALVKTFGKNTTDTVSLTEQITLVFTKVLADSMGITDDLLARILIPLLLNDTVTLGDVAVKTITKVLLDTVTMADTLAKAMGVSKTDIVTIIDSLGKLMRKDPADTVAIIDTFNKTIVLNPSDSVAIAESLIKAITKALGDNITLADAILVVGPHDRIYENLPDRLKGKRGVFTSKPGSIKAKIDPNDVRGDIFTKKLY